jgi:hypothetical protein
MDARALKAQNASNCSTGQRGVAQTNCQEEFSKAFRQIRSDLDGLPIKIPQWVVESLAMFEEPKHPGVKYKNKINRANQELLMGLLKAFKAYCKSLEDASGAL